MRVSRETMEKIYDLSDTDIMKEAGKIIEAQMEPVSNAQMKNLENICLSQKNVGSIISFIEHQIKKNKYRDFYSAVKNYIKGYIKRKSNEISRNPTESKEIQYLLTKEFIQHLECENMYKSSKKDKRRHRNDKRNR